MSVGTTDSQEGEEEEGSHIGRAAVPAYLQGPLCRRCLQRHLHILAEPGHRTLVEPYQLPGHHTLVEPYQLPGHHTLVEPYQLTGVVLRHPAGIPYLSMVSKI